MGKDDCAVIRSAWCCGFIFTLHQPLTLVHIVRHSCRQHSLYMSHKDPVRTSVILTAHTPTLIMEGFSETPLLPLSPVISPLMALHSTLLPKTTLHCNSTLTRNSQERAQSYWLRLCDLFGKGKCHFERNLTPAGECVAWNGCVCGCIRNV